MFSGGSHHTRIKWKLAVFSMIFWMKGFRFQDDVRAELYMQALAGQVPLHLPMQYSATVLESHWNNFHSSASQCRWSPPPSGTVEYGWRPDLPDVFPNQTFIPLRERFAQALVPVSSSICTIPDRASSDTWFLHRVGPIQSVGGRDWHSFDMYNAFDLKRRVDQRQKTRITAISTHCVDGGHRLVGTPPLNVHHSEITVSSSLLASRKIPNCLICNHEDAACDPQHGNFYCQMKSFPKGFGLMVEHEMDAHALINDNRVSDSASFKWWWEVAIKVAPEHVRVRPLQKWKVNTPRMLLSSPFCTMKLPLGFAVVFASSIPTRSGRLVNFDVHSHSGLQEAWIFDGRPDELEINVNSIATPPDLQVFKSSVLTRMARRRMRFRCVIHPNHVPPEMGERRSSVQCFDNGDLIVAHKPIMALAFFHANSDGQTQHFHFSGYVAVNT